MALPTSTLIWRVRPGGDDLNGGGFVSGGGGVDRSQQDEAQASGTNLTVDASVNTDVLPDDHTPDAADVNNVIQITGGDGFTPGAYHIVSIQSGKWRLDRSPAATGASGGVWSLGGALASPGKAGGLHVGGNVIDVAGGTYTMDLTANNVAGGRLTLASPTAGSWTRLRGDPSNRPVFRPAANVSAYLVSVGTYFSIENVIFNGADYSHNLSRALWCPDSNASRGTVVRCRFEQFIATFPVNENHGMWDISECAWSHTNGALDAPGGSVKSCTFVDVLWGNNAGAVSVVATHPFNMSRCVFANGSRWFRIYANSVVRLQDCIFYNCPSTDMLFFQSSNGAVLAIEACIFEQIGGYGIAGAIGASIRLRDCAYYACTSGLHNGLITEESGTIAGSESFFVDAAAGDFNLNNAAGGGALLRSVTKALAA